MTIQELEHTKILRLYHLEEIISSLNMKAQGILFLILADLKDSLN